MSHVIIWQVTGMTCMSCEKLIGNVLKDVPGVIETEVSVKKAKAAVRMRGDARDPDLELVNAQLSSHGYRLYPEGCALPRGTEPFSRRLWRAVMAVFLVGFVLLLLSPARKILPSVSVGSSIGALFLLGIVASVSTCLASTGGFMLAYSAEVTSRRKTLLMHAGRLVAFVAGGAVLGALGGALPQGSAVWYGAFALVLGVGLLAVGLNLLDLGPSFARRGIALPSSLHGIAERVRRRPGGIAPFFVGAVTFILPCGFTQTAQALALTSGSAARGAAFMAAFALGTLPVLLGVTTFASKATLQHRALRLTAGVLVAFFALSQIQSGLAVFGMPVRFPSLHDVSAGADAQTAPTNGVQLVKMAVTSFGFEPSSFIVRRGVPVRWEIDGKDITGCTSAIVSRDLGISERLKSGPNVITFTPQRAGTVAFSCPMGMVRGSFTVMN